MARPRFTALALVLGIGHLAAVQAGSPQIHLELAAKMGMTWGVSHPTNSREGDVVFVSCHGEPGTENGSCNAYEGDTQCSAKRPVLCLSVDGRPLPHGESTDSSRNSMPDDFYSGWANGHVALTNAVRGDRFASRDEADAFCASTFGKGWRMAEHHDGRTRSGSSGGWGFKADGRIADESRFWVAINDQPANCWD